MLAWRWRLHREVLENVQEIHHVVHVFNHEIDGVVLKYEGDAFPGIEQIAVATKFHCPELMDEILAIPLYLVRA